MSRYSKIYPIAADDIAMDYHVNLTAILVYIQNTIQCYMSKAGVAAFDVKQLGLLWVISEYDIRFTGKRPLWKDDVTATLWVSEITPVRIYFEFRLCDNHGREFACGAATWTLIDETTRKPYVHNLEFLSDKIEIDSEMVFGKHSKNRLPAFEDKVLTTHEYYSSMPDVDFNGHVCNRSYLSAALGCIPLEYERTHKPTALYIRYAREAFVGDVLHAKSYRCVCEEEGKEKFLNQIVNDEGLEISSVVITWESEPTNHLAIRETIKRD